MAKVIVIREERCLACKTCVTECRMAHTSAATLVEALAVEAPPQARVYVEPAGGLSLALQCRHCADAPCVLVCPKDAIRREVEDGPVLIDPDLCIGCRFCTVACPYGMIEMSPVGKLAVKCDLCVARPGAPGQPACVEACPTSALEFRVVDDELAAQREEVEQRVLAALREAPAPGGGAKVAGCVDCGAEVVPAKMLDVVRGKLPERFAVASVCPRCRRQRLAGILVELSPAGALSGDRAG